MTITVSGNANASVRAGRGEVIIHVYDEHPAAVIFPSGRTRTLEEGEQTTYNMRLDTRPARNVVVTPTSADTSIATVSRAVTFTPANWKQPQAVTVTAAGNGVSTSEDVVISHAVTTGDGAGYTSALSIGDVTLTVQPIPDVTVSTGTLSISEGGTSASYTLVLDSQPTHDVTVTVNAETGLLVDGPDAGTAGAATETLTFTSGPSGTWGTAQTITVFGVDDDIDQGASRMLDISHAATSTDTDYNNIDIDGVSVTVTDDDTAGVTLTQSDGSTSVTETAGGSNTDTYTVVLDSEPTHDVTVTVNAETGLLVDGPDAGTAGAATETLTFTSGPSGTWGSAQTITVFGVDDDIDQGASRMLDISHAATSTDTDYNNIDIDGVSVTVTDDDTTGVTLTQSDGSTSVTETAGGSNTDTYTVVLDSEPTHDVTVTVNAETGLLVDGPDAGTAGAATETLTFTSGPSGTWGSAQTITVFGVDDDIDQGASRMLDISHAATSTDTDYNNIDIDGVSVTVTDDDTAGVTLTQSDGSTSVTEAAGGSNTDTYTVVLDSEPTHDVTVTVNAETGLLVDGPDAGTAGAATETLTFTSGPSGTWGTAQTITVFGMDDNIDQGAGRMLDISHAATSTDTDYNNIDIDGVSVTVTDDDATTVMLTTPDTTATEGSSSDTASITLTLNRGLRSGESLAVPLQFSGGTVGTHFTLAVPTPLPAGVTFSGSTVTFTGPSAGATATSATVLLTASADSDMTDETVTVSIPSSSSSGTPRLTATGLDGGVTGSGTGRITVDDNNKVLALSVAASGGAEGNSGHTDIDVTVSRPAGGAAVSYSLCFSGTATRDEDGNGAAGEDYQVINTSNGQPQTIWGSGATAGCVGSSGTATLTSTSHTWKLRVLGDTAEESHEEVVVTLNEDSTNPLSASWSISPSMATYTIGNDDTPGPPRTSIAAGTSPVTEGDTATFTLYANPTPTTSMEVVLVVLDAPGVSDFVNGGDEGVHTVTFAPGETSKVFTVQTRDDAHHEEDGSVTVKVAGGYRGSPDTVQVMVTDNDAPLPHVPPVIFVSSQYGSMTASRTVNEGETAYFCYGIEGGAYPSNHPPRFWVKIEVTSSSGRVLIDSTALQLGTATKEMCLDFSTWGAAGETWTARVLPGGQVFYYGRNIHLYEVDSASTATITVLGQDAQQVATPPAVTIAADAASVTEGGEVTFTVTADPAPGYDLRVNLGAAEEMGEGLNYIGREQTGTVTLPADATSATWTVTAWSDEQRRADGTVVARIKPGDGYTAGTPSTVTVALLDDDGPPEPVATQQPAPAVDPSLVAQVRILAGQTHHGAAHVLRWRRVLVAFGVEAYPGVTAMTAAQAEANARRYSSPLWPRIAETIAALEAAPAPEPETQPGVLPAVSVAAGDAISEGGDASFTLTATPDPASPLAVSVTVGADGAFGVPTGARTVTIPVTGSLVLTLPTVDDAADEPDGSVSLTLNDGNGYTVGSPASGAVSIEDDDLPPPEVSITAKAGSVTEGTGAAFTLTAAPEPAAPLAVEVTVAAEGAFGIAGGKRTVTIPVTGSVVLTLPTVDDGADEPDGSVSLTLKDGNGYTVGSPASGAVSIEDNDLPPPEVSITAKAGSVTEGTGAAFTLTAAPEPAAPLAVEVTVAAEGAFGIAGGKRTVTIPVTGSVVLTLPTVDDGADEPDGSVRVTLNDGNGYTVGSASSGTVAVEDNDLPPPEVSITAKAGSITEGAGAVFTVTADRAPDTALAVRLTVSEAAGSDFVVAADEGERTVTIPAGKTGAALTVATDDDGAHEPDGSVTATVVADPAYRVGSASFARVTVRDDDGTTLPALSIGDASTGEGDMMHFTIRLSAPTTRTVRFDVESRESTPMSARANRDFVKHRYRDVQIRAGGTRVRVGIYAFGDSHDEEPETFEVVLSNPRGAVIDDGLAVGTITNSDPLPAAFLSRFGRTVTEQALDGIAGRMAAPRTPGRQGTLAGQAIFGSDGSGAFGTGPAGSGPMGAGAAGPGLAGSGLVHGGSGLAGPGFDGPGLSGSGLSGSGLSGSGFGGSAGAGATALSTGGNGASASGAQGYGHYAGPSGSVGSGFSAQGYGQAPMEPQSSPMTLHDVLLGSSFTLTGEKDGAGGSLAFWGRASQGSFDGAERGDGTDITLDGTVTTGMLGADYARGNWLVGLALTQSSAEGGYAAIAGNDIDACSEMGGEVPVLCDGAVRSGDGDVEASLTAAVPYAALQASERLKLWGAAGYGSGEVTLKTAMGERYGADTRWSMAAAGLRGNLLEVPKEGSGPALALTSDALWTRTSSERTRDLAASDSDATRLRLGLEGSWRVAMEDGAHLTPKLEVGARHDGGDAETGIGVEVGGGIAWSDPALGLSLDVSGRTLLAHENDDLKDRGVSAALAFDPEPAAQRGPSFALRQELGGRANGGLDALFAPAPLEDRTGSEATRRWAMEAAYGFPAFGGRFTGSPHVGLGLATGARDYSVGWRLTPEAASAPDLSFGLRATRRESATAEPEHAMGLEITAHW